MGTTPPPPNAEDEAQMEKFNTVLQSAMRYDLNKELANHVNINMTQHLGAGLGDFKVQIANFQTQMVDVKRPSVRSADFVTEGAGAIDLLFSEPVRYGAAALAGNGSANGTLGLTVLDYGGSVVRAEEPVFCVLDPPGTEWTLPIPLGLSRETTLPP